MRTLRGTCTVLAAIVLAAIGAGPALATNGMYLAGYGSQAAGRGGANLAVADNALGLQSNPAGIMHIDGRELDLEAQFLAPHLQLGGAPFGRRTDGESKVFTMPAFSYVQGDAAHPLSFGVALISQGGMGATFDGIPTPFGTQDRTSSEVRFATLTPTVAYELTPRFALGASLNVGYSDVRFAFWPRTSFYDDGGTPADPSDDQGFFGAELTTRARAITTSARLGGLWHANRWLTLGGIYQSETSGDYDHGTLTLNQDALGAGRVRYDATVEGFTWPAQYGAGVELRPAPRWVVAADVRRYLWEHAMERITVKGTDPSSATPVAEVVMPFEFDWKNQWVVCAGLEFAASDAITLRAGWNHGESPVPDATLNPLFPATTSQHLTAGTTWRIGGHALNLAVERALESEQVNRNANPNVNPFGPGMLVDHSQWTVSLGYGIGF